MLFPSRPSDGRLQGRGTHVVKQRYIVLIELQDEGGYDAPRPARLGCHSQGETLEESLDRIKEAIDLYLDLAESRNHS